MWRAFAATLLLFACGSCSDGLPEPVDPESIRLEIELLSNGSADFPSWEAFLVNRGEETVTVVLPGDGSRSGSRTPRIEWIVETDGEERIQTLSGGHSCGKINALTRDEVVRLAPEESVALNRYGFGRPALPETGEALVRVRYTHDPMPEWGLPLGEHDERAMALVRASTAFSATSNAVRWARD